MKKQRSIRLLTKSTSIYLIFTFIAFLSSALFLIDETDKFIHKDLESSFMRYEHRLKRYIGEGKPIDRLHTHVELLPPESIPAAGTFPVYADTLIFNQNLEEMQVFRSKTIVFEAGDSTYKAVLLQPVDDFLKLRDDILGSIIPAFILLAVAIVLFNYALSGYFFRPFYRILDLMKTYQVGRNEEIKSVETSTAEFIKMQRLFHQMLDRIEYDYRHLKEYTENMAHEIQTPLAVMRNKVENLIADEAVMKKQADTIKIIYDETNYLSRLGHSLNLLTKIENGEFNNAVVIKTLPVIQKLAAAVDELARLKSIAIRMDLSPEHQLLIDPYLLDIALKNLIRNAISYSLPDHPVHILTTESTLTISNYGPPLEESGKKIFQRFYRQKQSKTSLGLGLSLVRKICELNDLDVRYHYQDNQHVFTIESRTGIVEKPSQPEKS